MGVSRLKNKERLINFIHEENTESSVVIALEMLESKEVTVVTLYEDILREALYRIDCAELDKECIWREHIKTAIVRTIIEVSYPYVIKELKNVTTNNKKIIVVCPSEEYHEIGARMAHNFFTLKGYNSTFIGANTPKSVILDAIKYLNPDYVAISVTNFYNVIKAKRIIESIKEKNPNITVLAGGQAFSDNKALQTVGADFHVTTFDSIEDIT